MIVVIYSVMSLWPGYALIALALSAPVVYFGRKRVSWHGWELLAVVLPFAIWGTLAIVGIEGVNKGMGNLAELTVLALAVPVAAVVRVIIASRLQERSVAVGLLSVLCAAAVVLYVLTPPLAG